MKYVVRGHQSFTWAIVHLLRRSSVTRLYTFFLIIRLLPFPRTVHTNYFPLSFLAPSFIILPGCIICMGIYCYTQVLAPLIRPLSDQ